MNIKNNDNLSLAAMFDASALEMALTTPNIRENFNLEMDFGEDNYLANIMRQTAERALTGPVQPLDNDTADGICRHICSNGMVLLKNNKRLLPLVSSSVRTVALIGPNTSKHMYNDLRRISPENVQILNAAGCPSGNTFSDELLAVALSTAVRSDIIVLCLDADDSPHLPAPQLALLEAISMLGKPVVAAVFGTYLNALETIDKKTDAVLLVWKYTRFHGAALGYVLFGQVNPSGHLPVTLSRLPEDEASYLYARHDPLYPFGYGLSYTHFTYSELKLSEKKISPGQPISFECVVENTGALPGHEVAQFYLRQEGQSEHPRWKLFGFNRIFLQKGEHRSISFELPEIKEPARYAVYAGGHQPDARSVWLTETPVLSAFFEVE
jgi:beta-glucosidase